MRFSFDLNGVVAIAEEMPRTSVAAVEGLRVHAVQPVHSSGKARLGGFEHEVVVRADQAVAETAPPEPKSNTFEQAQEVTVVRHRHEEAICSGRLADDVVQNVGSQ